MTDECSSVGAGRGRGGQGRTFGAANEDELRKALRIAGSKIAQAEARAERAERALDALRREGPVTKGTVLACLTQMERAILDLKQRLDEEQPLGLETGDHERMDEELCKEVILREQEVLSLKRKLNEANITLKATKKQLDESLEELAVTKKRLEEVPSASSELNQEPMANPYLATRASEVLDQATATPNSNNPVPMGGTLKRVRDRMVEGRFATIPSKSLFVIKGKVRVRATAVEVAPQSITRGDVFVLETESHLMTFIGHGASRHKVAKAVDLVKKIQRKRGAAKPAQVLTFDASDGADCTAFWKELGATGPPNSALPEAQGDAEWETSFLELSALYRLDAAGAALIKVAEPKLVREILQSEACYIYTCPTEVYVWQGKKTDAHHRNSALVEAQHLLEKSDCPDWVFVKRMTESAELAAFEDKFVSWPDDMSKIIGKVAHGGVSTKTQQVLPRILDLIEGSVPIEREPVTEPDGTMEVCSLTKEMKRIPFSPSSGGIYLFYECDVYLACYRAPSGGRVYFYWVGAKASTQQQGCASSLSKQWLDEMGQGGNLVRVEQGKEPSTFLLGLCGSMVVLEDSEAPTSTRMVHVRGNQAKDTRSLQCPVSPISLHSDDCFIVCNSDSNFVWVGTAASPHCADTAMRVASAMSPHLTPIREVELAESTSFWTSCFGVSSGFNSVRTQRIEKPQTPMRFWICANVNKTLTALLQRRCVQQDLSHTTMAMMDLGAQIYLWFGCDVALEDKILLSELSLDYLSKSQRLQHCSVWTMEEGQEVIEFTSHFQAWRPSLLATRRKHTEVAPPVWHSERCLHCAQDIIDKRGKKYSLKELSDRDFLPEGVDAKEIERFLRDEDFPLVFAGIDAQTFWGLPSWKRTELKKGSVLF